jgi:hypothetical protein
VYEFGIDASKFFNSYAEVYRSASVTETLKKIERKHYVGVGNVRLPFPTMYDKLHHIQMSLQT